MIDLSPLLASMGSRTDAGESPSDGSVQRDPPDHVGRFRLVERLGGGGMADVWRAIDERSGTPVAIKFASPDIVRDPRGRQRFLAESEVLQRLSHPGIVRALESGGDDDDDPYLVMEAIDGVPLRQIVRTFRSCPKLVEDGLRDLAAELRPPRGSAWARRLPAVDLCLVHWALEVAVALAHAHERGVLHRDVSPTNILIDTSGRARLIDFGVARVVVDRGVSLPGDVLGTPGYLAPEAWAGEALQASDVFSLASVLFECLAGQRAYGELGLHPARRGQEAAVAPSLAEFRPTLSGPIDWVCRMALAWSSDARYPSARAFAEDLRRVLFGRRTVARPPPWPRRVRERWRARPIRAKAEWLLGGSAALALAFAALTKWDAARLAWQREEAREEVAAVERAQRRKGIKETLAQLGTTGLSVATNDIDFVFRLARSPDPDTVDLVAQALDGVTEELRAARDRVIASHRGGGAVPAGAVHAAQRADVPVRHHRTAILCCEALGRIGIARGAVPSLERHLEVQYDTDGAAAAGLALARLMSVDADESKAREMLGRMLAGRPCADAPDFRTRVLPYVSVTIDPATVAAASTDLVAPPRRVHGTVRDSVTGADCLAPAYVESWMGFGLPRDNHREVRDRLRLWDLRIESTPTDPALWAQRAEARRLGGDLLGAAADLTRAVELDPRAIDWRLARAAVRRLQGDFLGAEWDCSIAIELAPKAVAPLVLRGLTHADAGNGPAAILDLDAALARDPRNGSAFSYRAMAYLGEGAPSRAEFDAIVATLLLPENAEAWNCVAVARLDAGRVTDAIHAANRALDAGSGYYLGWNTLGVARLLSGDAVGARDALRHATRIDPWLPFAWVNLGVVALRERDSTQALRDFDEAIDRSKSRLAAAWLGRAQACRALGRMDEVAVATEALRRISGTNSAGPLGSDGRARGAPGPTPPAPVPGR